MSTFLFAWNPSKFSWKKPNHLNEDLAEDIATLKQGKKQLIRLMESQITSKATMRGLWNLHYIVPHNTMITVNKNIS